MFGIIYTIIGIVGKIGWHNKQVRENRNSFYRTYDPRKNTYLDMYCVERRPNGEYCKTEIDGNGDLVQKNKYNKIVRNFSEEKRMEEASSSNTTVIRLSEKNLTHSLLKEPGGIRYKDKKTGQIYVIRAFRVDVNEKEGHCVYFYMRESDAMLERVTDGEIKYGTLKDYGVINKFIVDFNNKQKTQEFYLVMDKYHEQNRRDRDRELSVKI